MENNEGFIIWGIIKGVKRPPKEALLLRRKKVNLEGLFDPLT
jgi:hypothetical protein